MQKEGVPPRGWVFFDRDCRICTSLVCRFRRPLEKRGFGLAALQDPRVQALLALPPGELLREMRVATIEGKVYGGAEAIVYLAGQIWWAWPLHAAANLPGVPRDSRCLLPLVCGSPKMLIWILFHIREEDTQ